MPVRSGSVRILSDFPKTQIVEYNDEKDLTELRKNKDYTEMKGAYGEPVFLPKIKSDIGNSDILNLINEKKAQKKIQQVRNARRKTV